MNLLDLFVLQHAQVSLLHAELLRPSASGEHGQNDAKVEFNMKPRIFQAEKEAPLPSYQVSARLKVESGKPEDSGPAFNARIAIEAVYHQINGEPVDLAKFTASTASLARQLYPLLQLELRSELTRLGISGTHMPYDLNPRVENAETTVVRKPESLH
jgi:hypothetical protein